MDILKSDRIRMQDLANQWMEAASQPLMAQRRKDWQACRDLKGEHPMIKCDAFMLDGFVTDAELICRDPELRRVERKMTGLLRQFRTVGDDLVLNDTYEIPWKIDCSGFNLDATIHRADSDDSNFSAYSYENPIQKPEDVELLRPQEFSVDRKATLVFRDKMEYAFDGILPVRVGNLDYTFNGFGENLMTGNNWCNPLFQLFKFAGYENLMIWMMEEPEAIHAMMRFFTDDLLRYYHFAEEEGLLVYNADANFAGSVSYGFCADLPRGDSKTPASLKDCWGWCEAQEGIVISPNHYREFVAPYMGQLAQEFGLVQYGCCERHDDRYDIIMEFLPNVRAFTTTCKWNNIRALHEQCQGKQVIVAKVSPENICSEKPMWELYDKELRELRDITGGKNLEILIGDIITVKGEWGRFNEAIRRFRDIMDC